MASKSKRKAAKQTARKSRRGAKNPKSFRGANNPAGRQRERAAAAAAALTPEQEQAAAQRALRGFHFAFSRNVPKTLVAHGSYDFNAVPEGDPAPALYGNVKGVPDGQYRVEGGDFVYTVKGGAVVLVEKARADMPADTVIPVPAQ